MRKASRFKTEAEWTAAAHHLLPAAGVLALLAALPVGWLGAAG
jgi:hypothetical protein